MNMENNKVKRSGGNKDMEDTEDIKGFVKSFPIWEKLEAEEKEKIESGIKLKDYAKGGAVHDRGRECSGLILVRSGRLRAYILSGEGREITIYRLFKGDMCLFSASCMMHSLRFDVMVEAEEESSVWFIQAETYKEIMETSAVCANYTNEIMGKRFSDVMWLMEQVMWKSFDKRLAGFLLEESEIEHSDRLKITHETIALHLGTAREVVTRMLKYLQNEKMVSLKRGEVELTDIPALKELAGD